MKGYMWSRGSRDNVFIWKCWHRGAPLVAPFLSFPSLPSKYDLRTEPIKRTTSSSPLCLLFPGTGVDLLCSRTALPIKICNFIICITKPFSLLYSTHALCVCFYGASVFRSSLAFQALRCYCGCYDLCQWVVCMSSADELAWVNQWRI